VRLLPRVTLSAVVLLACLAILEWWARHNLYDEWYVRSSSPELRFELKTADSRARFDDGGRIQLPKPAGTIRIAVLGDSVAWGSHLGPDQTIPRQLEGSLQANPVRPGERYEVLNAAVPGYDIHQSLAMYRERVLAYDPDVVLYLFAVNDFVVSDFLEANGRILMVLPSSTDDTIGAPGPLISRLVSTSSLAAWMYTTHLARKHKDPKGELIRVDYEWGGRSLAAMAELARSEGDTFVPFLLGPFGTQLPPDAACHQQGMAVDLCWMTLALSNMRQHCAQQGLDCVDINDMLRSREDRDFRITPGDLMHPNAEGAHIWAEAIAEHLRGAFGG
jgi:lysophospholipase L1-like esterase